MSYKTVGKPILDYLIVMLLLVPGLVLGSLIVVGYIICGEWPVLFKQARIGRKGRIFTLLKFRTLDNDTQKTLHERRFVWGTLLRLSNLDELPQVLNVLKGEMSWVGPRPLPEEYRSLFSQQQNQRHDVLPGITGLAQVNGKNNSAWQEKFNYDIYYINNVSVWLDITILFKTVILVFSFKKDTSLNEEKFTG